MNTCLLNLTDCASSQWAAELRQLELSPTFVIFWGPGSTATERAHPGVKIALGLIDLLAGKSMMVSDVYAVSVYAEIDVLQLVSETTF